ncbi:glycoside hydrolase/phage tail family protein [Rhizobium sp. FKY42]|uniref:baseplate multidomain protein megatron n=1 Tax=Rhizobium sp. FKY42 TaxID=2562310 RepID=UPI0010C0436B|nr:glycoside hydrolase/phage tail family protein [Rhizobium sp. FKY42]
MATILFQAAGAALGSVFGPVGAMIGRAAGGLAGAAVDRALLGSPTVTGPRLATARLAGADEGTGIPRLYGTMRIGGTLIWATRFEEEVRTERSGGKATGGQKVKSFTYYANIALGLCEGEVAHVRRVWADGRELDLTTIQMRFYRGTEDQLPDPLIEAKQGAGKAPAFRGLAYVVFERLPLGDFGNRIPLLQFEVVRPIGALERQIRAVTIIPGSSEHGYATVQVTEDTGEGSARILNRNNRMAATDWEASLDELQALCPNLERVALVVSWFGTDLRAGECRIVPGVEFLSRDGESMLWNVAGIERADAHLVSRRHDAPAYGGTPSDESVKQAISDLKARGIEVYLYPFIMMDVAEDNTLPDPYGESKQAVYPWRGRITCHPAPGRAGSPDRTAQAASEIDQFCNRAEGYRRMVLHYADLAAAAGGVDGFIIGSEFRGLTSVRGAGNSFPFVAELVRLAADCRAKLGPSVRLTYGADWSEYFGYHPNDGTGDVFFHLDPLWASSAIDAVGIDNYMPLGDWRDSDLMGANPDGMTSAEDVAAMSRAITRGEGFDWYYASEADRKARVRSPITDGLAGKPWVFRFKDLSGWWGSHHFDRTGGTESPSPTAWVPRSKPIWFTELGCPAIDKGANQPNLFVDPKSSESGWPYFSSGGRSDAMQRRFLDSHHAYWQGDAAPANMVDADHIFVWSWDARPYPAFPQATSIWNDGENWRLGHWLTGRLGAGTLADTIAAILTDHGLTDFDVSGVCGDLTGYVQAETSSARQMLTPLVESFLLDVTEVEGRLIFRSRNKTSVPFKTIEVLAEREGEAAWSETRGHDSDFAAEAVLGFANPDLDYEQASVRSRRIPGMTNRVMRADIPGAMADEAAQTATEALLRDNHLSRRSIRFSLSPADMTLTPGDGVQLTDGPDGIYLVTRIEDGEMRRVEARRHVSIAAVGSRVSPVERVSAMAASDAFSPLVAFLDLPRFEDGEAASFARVAAFAKPWTRMLVSSSATTEGYRSRVLIERPARIGRLSAPLAAGAWGRFDRRSAIEVELPFGGLSSASEIAVQAGENRLAVMGNNGAWEVLAFATAQEVAPGRFRLSNLLRGLSGTEDAMAAGAAAGAQVVMLDEAVVPLGLTGSERGLALNWIVEPVGAKTGRYGPRQTVAGLRAETPLAPVHLKAERRSDGVSFSWVRRSRTNADDWDAFDIALDESEERYRLELLHASTGAVVAQAEVDACLHHYDLSQELSDFGIIQTSFRVRLTQLGRAVPRGIAREQVIIVRKQGVI